jgi:peptidoglycan hydrolase CwlO-like protein
MKRKLRWLTLVVAFAGMGIAMPQCPGQQALQQQVDTLQTSNSDLTKKLQAVDSQVKALNDEMNQVKQLLAGMANSIQESKVQVETMTKELKAKPSAQAKPASKKR